MATTPTHAIQVQMACEDLYTDPFDEGAKARIRELLLDGARPLMSADNYRRYLRVACDELNDDPSDVDAAYALLLMTLVPMSELVTSTQPAMAS